MKERKNREEEDSFGEARRTYGEYTERKRDRVRDVMKGDIDRVYRVRQREEETRGDKVWRIEEDRGKPVGDEGMGRRGRRRARTNER